MGTTIELGSVLNLVSMIYSSLGLSKYQKSDSLSISHTAL